MPEEKLTVPEALRLFIQRPAELCESTELSGVLAPGARADFVVLSEDITQIEPERIRNVDIEETYVSGKRVER